METGCLQIPHRKGSIPGPVVYGGTGVYVHIYRIQQMRMTALHCLSSM